MTLNSKATMPSANPSSTTASTQAAASGGAMNATTNITHSTFADKNLVLKCHFGHVIHRLPILGKENELAYDELCVMMGRIFKLSKTDTLTLKYKDNEGDLINLENDVDITHAISLSNVLNVFVYDKDTHPYVPKEDGKESMTKAKEEKLCLDDNERFKQDLLRLQRDLTNIMSKLEKPMDETSRKGLMETSGSKNLKMLSAAELDELLDSSGRKDKDLASAKEDLKPSTMTPGLAPVPVGGNATLSQPPKSSLQGPPSASMLSSTSHHHPHGGGGFQPSIMQSSNAPSTPGQGYFQGPPPPLGGSGSSSVGFHPAPPSHSSSTPEGSGHGTFQRSTSTSSSTPGAFGTSFVTSKPPPPPLGSTTATAATSQSFNPMAHPSSINVSSQSAPHFAPPPPMSSFGGGLNPASSPSTVLPPSQQPPASLQQQQQQQPGQRPPPPFSGYIHTSGQPSYGPPFGSAPPGQPSQSTSTFSPQGPSSHPPPPPPTSFYAPPPPTSQPATAPGHYPPPPSSMPPQQYQPSGYATYTR